MTRQSAKTTSLTITAMLTAMVFAATTFFKVPVGLGYIHFGDVFVILGALMLPRRQACFAGGAGAALADVIGGFAVWAPWTIFIKVGTALLVAQAQAMIRKGNRTGEVPEEPARSADFRDGAIRAAFYTLAAAWTAAGYYVAEGVIYGNWVVPLAGIPFNILQIAVGAVAAHFLFHVYARMGSAN
ncbi:MAG: ECF transporter S component [Mogibacterium sp.]|nr:ECF transporter S component [Mogibacterium sp.]